MDKLKRFIAPLVLIVILVLAWTSPLDAMSREQVDAGLKRALVTFATARMLNAVISVAQGTDVAIEPAGVGVKFSPGEILDPINDLVEKFSTLMLFASISFGIQKILITLGGHWVVSATLSGAVILWSVWHLSGRYIPEWCTKLLVISLVLRFAVPLVTVGSNALFLQFLANDYEHSQAILESGSAEVRKMAALNPPPQPQENRGLLDRFKEMTPNINVKERLDHVKDSAELWTERMINLMVVFLLQTLIFPLLLLWGLVSLARGFLVQLPAKMEYGKAD